MSPLSAERDERYSACQLCPRRCGVDRRAGQKGVCGETAVCRVASAGPHFGEEPSLSGTRGSGTLFFSGCSSGCFFCQNYQISIEHEGRPVSPAELLELARACVRDGVHNLNFVTPDHFWPHLAGLCAALREEGVRLPVVFNSSGYQAPELVGEYARHVDLFLPDFKFAEPDLAQACMGDRRYPEIALTALRAMVAEKGFLSPWDPTGARTAEQGVLVRHLVLPGQVENSRRVLRLLREEFGALLPLSIMSQFRPTPRCARRGLFNAPLAAADYAAVCREVEELGFRHVYLQPEMGDPDFLPDFRRAEPFAGNRRRAPDRP